MFNKFKKIFLISSVLTFTGLSVNCLAGSTSLYGSLAIDENQGDQYGFSYNYPTQDEADERAMSECGSGCSVVMTFTKGCAAYATDQYKGSSIYGWGKASSSYDAKNRALQECSSRGGKSCTVRVWGCNSR